VSVRDARLELLEAEKTLTRRSDELAPAAVRIRLLEIGAAAGPKPSADASQPYGASSR
jgi:hypothetical protein